MQGLHPVLCLQSHMWIACAPVRSGGTQVEPSYQMCPIGLVCLAVQCNLCVWHLHQGS